MVAGMTRGILSVALAAGLAAGLRANFFPPYQFRLSGPISKVEVVGTGGARRPVAEKPAKLSAKETVSTGAGAFVTLEIRAVGTVLVHEDTQLKVESVNVQGRPILELVDGAVMLRGAQGGAKEPLEVKFGDHTVSLREGALELRYKADKKAAAVSPVDGTAVLETPLGKTNLRGDEVLVNAAGQTKQRPVERDAVRKRWARFERAFEPNAPVFEDEVPPLVQIIAPTAGVAVPGPDCEVYGTVDDPSVTEVQIKLDNVFLKLTKVSGGEFRDTVMLKAKEQNVLVVAQDLSKNSGSASVSVKCNSPAVPVAPEAPTERSTWDRIVEVLKDPQKDTGLFAKLLGGGLLGLLVLALSVKKILGFMKKGAETAAGLATGVIFHRCEKCGEREFEYHLFYTTDPVTSPFMRNLINNVNPMATSIMNESLENLLNTGLSSSAAAKAAPAKIRVTCTWCDTCKVGNLKLEHMKATEVTKTDDYQIIHPIFIEWVRKVYD